MHMLQVQSPHRTDPARSRSRQLAPAEQQTVAVSAKAGYHAVSLHVVQQT